MLSIRLFFVVDESGEWIDLSEVRSNFEQKLLSKLKSLRYAIELMSSMVRLTPFLLGLYVGVSAKLF